MFLSLIAGIVYGLQWDYSPGYFERQPELDTVAVVTNEDGTMTRYEVPYCRVKMYHYRLDPRSHTGF
jgi:hypothetical protein